VNRTEKTAQIADVKGKFDKAISVALLDFQGLSVETVTALRREFRKAKIEYRVLKNTVIRHALKDSPYKSLVGDLNPERKNSPKAHAAVRGMTGVAWSYEDPSAPIKVVDAFKTQLADKAAKLKVKTGMVGGQLIGGEELGRMPGLKDTQAMIVGILQAPGSELYQAIMAPAIHIVLTLDAWVEKQKQAGG